MRFLLAASAALLCSPAAATAAAPFAELPFQPLRAGRVAACLQAAGSERVALLDSARRTASAVELLRVAADGGLVREGAVPVFPFIDCPSVAAAASGAAVVAAGTLQPEGMQLIVALRDAGGELGPPVPAQAGRVLVEHVDAAIASSGAAVVSWIETHAIRTGRAGRSRLMVVRRPAGGGLGAPERLGGVVDAATTEPVVGIDDAGRATVAWGGNGGRGDVVRVSTAAPGARFGAPQRLSRTESFDDPLALSVTDDGRAMLAYEEAATDGSRLRLFERVPGAARMTSVLRFTEETDRERERPVVALAPGGGALVAWLRERSDDRGPAVEVMLRAPGGAFQPPQVLDATVPGIAGWASSSPLPAFETPDDQAAPLAALGADGRVVVAWTEAAKIAGGDAPVRAAVAAGTLTGGWEGATLLGGPGRSADGLAVLAGPAAVLWTDNLPRDLGFEEPSRGGRLHRALPGVAPHDPAPPDVTLDARSQRVRSDDPVFVTATCSAACDLRAVAGRDPDLGGPAGGGVAQLDAAGTVRIALEPGGRFGMAPRRGGPLRVTLHATAPGGRRATVVRRDVRVRHAFVPRPRRPRDVRVVRRGERLLVTWRTAKPARAEEFAVRAGRRRTDLGSLGSRVVSGSGRSRFSVELDDRGRGRWVEIEWSSTEPRFKGGRMLVRVPSGA